MRQGVNNRAIIAVIVSLGLPSLAATAQEPMAKDDAALVVEGIVREVFRSPRKGQVDYLVQLEVRRSEAGRPPRGGVRPTYPAPGDILYIHVFQRVDASGRVVTGEAHRAVPTERAQVRAYLTPRTQGGWEGIVPDWFDLTSDRPAPAAPTDPAASLAETTTTTAPAPANPPATSPATPPATRGRSALSAIGLTAETLTVQGRVVLRVTGVERGSPAQQAGIEPGDIIAGANGAALTTPEQLDALARRGGNLSLIVVDVNTGRGLEVNIPLERGAGGQPPVAAEPVPADANANVTPKPATPPAAGAPRSLGISAEPIALGQRTALKVVRVDPDSPGARAGLEPGDVIVAANGAAVTGAEQLAAALRKSGPTLTLTVRDVRSGRDTPVEVLFGGGTKPASPTIAVQPTAPGAAPSPAPTPGSSSGGGRLGAVTELTFYDVEAAVKVTEVEAGSPAARAGLQPGLIILQANGSPVLHPSELIEAVRKSGPTLKLTVIDPRSNRKSTVNVSLDPGR